MINLYLLKEFKLPVTAECICPDIFQSKKREEIEGLSVWEGNSQKRLGELFKVEHVEGEETAVAISGDVGRVRRIGGRMTCGEVMIKGDAGMHLGEEMKGGRIIVHGNVGAWAGSMMKNGEILVHGNADDYLGAPYRGSNEGMSGGRIVVHGNAGNEAGTYMKRGIIKIRGNAGQFAGLRMRNGAIYVQKDCTRGAGACMTGGKIVIGGSLESVLPTFSIDNIKSKVKIEENEIVEGPWYVFHGDLAEEGNGKLYVSKEKNPLLSSHERFL